MTRASRGEFWYAALDGTAMALVLVNFRHSVFMLEIDLKSGPGAALLKAMADRHGNALAQAAQLLSRLFVIHSPLAPGLRFVGGEAKPKRLPTMLFAPEISFSLAGSSESLEDALASCIGEGIERLSQVEQPGDGTPKLSYADAAPDTIPAARHLIEEVLGHSEQGLGAKLAWVRGRMLANGSACLVPADWCLRQRAPGSLVIPGAALSTGSAAGASVGTAAARALLELVERDAASLWWIGGYRPRPVAADSTAMAEATRVLGNLRRNSRERTTWLLDITSDLDVPCVAAVSVDQEGHGLACGLAARLSLPEAARAAILEMCQMELAFPIVEMKRHQGGDAALNEIDRGHLARATKINAESCELLHPLGSPRREPEPPDAGEPLSALQAVFARCGLEAALVDLTRPEFGIPVVWAMAPELQLMPCNLQTERLRHAIATTGGGERTTNAVALF